MAYSKAESDDLSDQAKKELTTNGELVRSRLLPGTLEQAMQRDDGKDEMTVKTVVNTKKACEIAGLSSGGQGIRTLNRFPGA
jgi:hypothetical protein